MTADLKDPEYSPFRKDEVLTIAESFQHEENQKNNAADCGGLRADSDNGPTTAGARQKIRTSRSAVSSDHARLVRFVLADATQVRDRLGRSFVACRTSCGLLRRYRSRRDLWTSHRQTRGQLMIV